MTNIERLKQYLGKASFGSASDRYSALECVAEIERELAAKVGAGETEEEPCGHCCGTGRMVRDPDIGTDQECFVCEGSGTVPNALGQEPCANSRARSPAPLGYTSLEGE
jgi:DnaJ-class molecular chaperone